MSTVREERVERKYMMIKLVAVGQAMENMHIEKECVLLFPCWNQYTQITGYEYNDERSGLVTPVCHSPLVFCSMKSNSFDN